MSADFLADKNGLNLREYQLRAVEAAERAVKNGAQTVLLAMATGTGKTRTVLGMMYRFLKSGRFRRILFLVDRNALGTQALDVFKDVKLEELHPLDEIYAINGLTDKTIGKPAFTSPLCKAWSNVFCTAKAANPCPRSPTMI